MKITGIDQKKCSGCQVCVEDCPANLFSRDKKTGKIQHRDPNQWCTGCGHCIACCPENAVSYQLEDTLPGGELPENGDSMNFGAIMELLRGKRSVRGFTPRKVSEEDIADIIEAMRHAPSGHNIQACEYYVIRDREIIEKLRELTIDYFKGLKKMLGVHFLFKPVLNRYMYEIISSPGTKKGIDTLIQDNLSGMDTIFYSAPVVILISYPDVGRLSLADPVIATTYGMLAAHGKGIGSCWMGFTMDAVFKSKKARQLLGIEKDRLIGSVFTLGYPKTKYHRIPPRKEARIFNL